MSTAATTVREAMARVECGIAGVVEARLLMGELEALTWKVSRIDGEPVEVCRHCFGRRDVGHGSMCVAEEVV